MYTLIENWTDDYVHHSRRLHYPTLPPLGYTLLDYITINCNEINVYITLHFYEMIHMATSLYIYIKWDIWLRHNTLTAIGFIATPLHTYLEWYIWPHHCTYAVRGIGDTPINTYLFYRNIHSCYTRCSHDHIFFLQ